MKITDIFNAQGAVAYIEQREATNSIPYMGEAFFPLKRKMGIDLKWIKTRKGAGVSLAPSNFDALSTIRPRKGFEIAKSEMPFFRESMIVKEQDEMDIMRVRDMDDPYIDEVLSNIYDDVEELSEGARINMERMRMQLLFPENGNAGISIVANGVNYTYNYDPDGTWRLNNYTVLTGTDKWDAPSTADPVKTLETVRNKLRSMYGAESNVVLMNQNTFNTMTACNALKQRVFPGFDVTKVYVTGEEARVAIENAIGVSVVVYDKMFKDESKVTQKFVPDGYVAIHPARQLGSLWRGTTPEEADLLGSDSADVQIVNNGVAITRVVEPHPVNVNTFASEIVLPSFEAMDECACIKVY